MLVALTVAPAAGWACGILLLARGKTSPIPPELWLAELFSPPVGLLAPLLVVVLAPRRAATHRFVSSALRYYKLFGQLALVLVPAAMMASNLVTLNPQLEAYARRGALIYAVIFLESGRRAARAYGTQQRPSDARPPIVFIRDFDTEIELDAQVVMSTLRLVNPIMLVRWLMRKEDVRTLEDAIATRLSRDLGPLIALGNPLEALPVGDAERIYFSDENWQAEFARLVETAAAIVAQPGISSNLAWELAHIAANGHAGKLIVVTPPELEHVPTAKESLVGVLTKNAWQREQKWQGLFAPRPFLWFGFLDNLKQAGFKIDDTDVAAGAVIAFDEHCQAIVLSAGGDNPDEIARHIQEHVTAIKHSGRYLLDEPSEPSPPLVTYAFCGLLTILALIDVSSRGRTLDVTLGFIGPTAVSASSLEGWRLVTALFASVYAGNWLVHTLMLFACGRKAETILGHFGTLRVFAFSGILSGIAAMLIFPSLVVTEAAGAAFGLFGALGGVAIWEGVKPPVNTLFRLGVIAVTYAYFYRVPIDSLTSATGVIVGFALGVTSLPLHIYRSARKLQIATMIAALLLGAVMFGRIQRFQDISLLLRRVLATEQECHVQFDAERKNALEMRRTGAEFASAIESKVISPLRGLELDLHQAPQNITPRQRVLLKALNTLVSEEIHGFETIADAVRQNRTDLARAGSSEIARAVQQFKTNLSGLVETK